MIEISFADIVILFGGVFAWLLALGSACTAGRRVRCAFPALLFFLLGYAQILRVVNLEATHPNLDFGLRVFIACAYFCVGPLVYLTFRSAVDPSFGPTFRPSFGPSFGPSSGPSGRHLLHFVPFPLSMVVVVLGFVAFGAERSFDSGLIGAMIVAAMVSVGVYGGVALVKMAGLIRGMTQRARRKIRLGIVYLGAVMLVIGSDIANRLLPIDFTDAVLVAASLLFVAYYLLSRRHPEYLNIIQDEARRIRYEKSCLTHVDVAEALGNLRSAMDKRKLYLRDDITLADLADEVGVTAHQLSEILNTQYQKNFPRFVNDYRIEEAKRRLQAYPDQTVLTVAYSSGFATASAFYAAFKRATGVSPAFYRKRAVGA